MIRFLGVFLIFIALYHLFITTIGYGVLWGEHLQQLITIKEVLFILAILAFAVSNFKATKKYFSQRKNVWIIFAILLIYAVWISFLHDKSLYNMVVGIKYNFHFIAILLGSTLLWSIFAQHKGNTIKKQLPKIINYSQYFLIFVAIIWLMLQILRITDSERFMKIGFGPVGDFAFGQNPPVYYRTWPGGTPRLQGLFAGPNNYWYFLIAFFPLILFWRKRKRNKIKELFWISPQKLINMWFVTLWIISILATLSRTALIGGAVAFALINKKRINQHKKVTWIILVWLIGAFVGLSFRKGGSTQEHITSKISWLQTVIDQPLGFGLGTAGPSIHHGGTLLPENYYLQVMADIGTLWFLIWALLIFQFLSFNKNIQKYFEQKEESDEHQALFLHRKYLLAGRSCLLIMWLFLHVFEDSMVNYLFFIPFGVLTGYLSTLNKKTPPIFPQLPIKK